MTKVSLRAYDREIEGLIEHSQRLDEAVAHCRHILKTYPKHLETYRLLGKAYLEGKRYDQAVDIFQRVLMAAPEDFVSHVGMSIIADDKGRLDEAIWHMERAFEVQPANAAIQGELQRLFGRRDGVEPTRIRLTRGALARMYVQGELYGQAISEIRAVLGQDPKRTDLQVLLADVYFRSGQKNEAVTACGELLSSHPYCLDANRIMVEILPGIQSAESVQEFRKRVNDLDPYAAFVQDSVFHSDAVPDSAASLERLEYSGQPTETATALGIGLGAGSDRDIAKSSPARWTPTAPSVPTPAAAQSPSSDDIPPFMRSAGWGPTAEAAADTGAVSAPNDEYEPAAVPADLPAWVKALAPTEDAQQEERVDQSQDEVPEWLRASSEHIQSAPAGASADLTETDLPDWLKRLGEPEPAATSVPASTPVSPMEVNEDATTPERSLEVEGISPDWIQDAEPEIEKSAEEAAPPDRAAAPDSANLRPALGLGSLGTTAKEQADAMAWLEGLAAKHGAKPEELLTDPASRPQSAPEWVDRAMDAGQQSAETRGTSGSSSAHARAEEPSKDAWVEERGSVEKEYQQPDQQAEPAAAEPADDWLGNLKEKDAFAGIEADEAEEEAPIMDESQAPVWFGRAEDKIIRRAEIGEEPTWISTPAAGTPTPAGVDEPAADALGGATDLPDWLAGLDREESRVGSSASADDLPPWLQAETEPQAEAAEPARPADWQPAESRARTEFRAGEAEQESPAVALAPVAADALIPGPAETRPRSLASPLRPDGASLGNAQSELSRGNIAAALDLYGRLIRRGRSLEDIIRDLRDALYRYPVEVPIWQALGDAYMRANRLQEALDAYTKAEELLR